MPISNIDPKDLYSQAQQIQHDSWANPGKIDPNEIKQFQSNLDTYGTADQKSKLDPLVSEMADYQNNGMDGGQWEKDINTILGASAGAGNESGDAKGDYMRAVVNPAVNNPNDPQLSTDIRNFLYANVGISADAKQKLTQIANAIDAGVHDTDRASQLSAITQEL